MPYTPPTFLSYSLKIFGLNKFLYILSGIIVEIEKFKTLLLL